MALDFSQGYSQRAGLTLLHPPTPASSVPSVALWGQVGLPEAFPGGEGTLGQMLGPDRSALRTRGPLPVPFPLSPFSLLALAPPPASGASWGLERARQGGAI